MGCPFRSLVPITPRVANLGYRAVLNDDEATRFENSEQSYTATCPEGTMGEPVEVIIPAGTYVSYQSQEIADAQALAKATEEAEAALECGPIATEWRKVLDSSPPLGQYWAGSPSPSVAYTTQDIDGFTVVYSSALAIVSTGGDLDTSLPNYSFLEIDFDYTTDTDLKLTTSGAVFIEPIPIGAGHITTQIASGVAGGVVFKTTGGVTAANYTISNFRYRYTE
jgi:hypothetical protein